MNKFLRPILFTIIAIITAILLAYVHSYQIQYINLLTGYILYSAAGIIIGRININKLYRRIFLLPIFLILGYGFFVNPNFRVDAFSELIILSISFLIGLSLKSKKTAIIFSVWTLLVFSWCFYFSPSIQFKKANGSVDYSNVSGKFDFNKLVLLDINGNRIPPSFFNDKIIVLDYWFIGCAPCYSKIKELKRVQEYFKSDSSIQIFAVNNGNDDSFSSFVQECERRKFDNFSLYDKGGYFSKKYSVQAFPFEIIIKNGTIVSTSIGFNEDMKLLYTKKLIEQIKNLKK
jgi:hypothetical protein